MPETINSTTLEPHSGDAQGVAPALPRPGWKSSEYWLNVLVTLFTMGAGWYVLTHADVDIDRFLIVCGALGTVAYGYTQNRTSLKKTTETEARFRAVIGKVQQAEKPNG